MLTCDQCGAVPKDEDAVFTSKEGALVGPWWFCDVCYDEMMEKYKQEDAYAIL